MSSHETKELIPCVIINTYDNSSDSDESIIVDATTIQYADIPKNDDKSPVAGSNISLHSNQRNDEYNDNAKSTDSSAKVDSIAMSECENTTFGNVTYFKGPIIINETISDYNNIVKETISNSDTEPLIAHSSEKDLNKVYWSQKKKILMLVIATVVLSNAIFFTISYFVARARNYVKPRNDLVKASVEEIDYTSDYELTTVELQFDYDFKVVSRSEWHAQKPKSTVMDLLLPATRVIIADTETSTCSTERCSQLIRSMQAFHINSNLGDIKYNFLVGGDGYAYVGRGWDKQGSIASGININSISISFIGNFTSNAPPQQQIIAAQKLISEGVRLNKLIPNYYLYGHGQVTPTTSPGEVLYAIIRKWNHWSDTLM